ncbi:hypothetical protein E4K67_17200 [Desulfosporosinus fructosivorans]|uniref:HEAT repeat domain-containing protein n=1 Tax=Desulfosporosinus fructosivorans TaxID=2018669 RepID=A0A4Z0R2W8_9FIRM|nr:hypothetical protein [Desulfosporosinus fructosivorans]TGE36839.1 hypothetical protein E4K67_17200 [Desulfosporosinus fructosivorans]
MSKRYGYFSQIEPLLLNQSSREIEQLLLNNSNLPGPRSNLELVYAFADHFRSNDLVTYKWELLQRFLNFGLDSDPHNSPAEFLPICALVALGTFYIKAESSIQKQIVSILWDFANNSNWRLREAVAMSFQCIEEQDFDLIPPLFNQRINDVSLLEMRAIIAALAHPPVLKVEPNSVFCLLISDIFLSKVVTLDVSKRKTEEFRVLRKGLEYSLSVFVASLPAKGFAFLSKWVMVNDTDIKKILKSNLGKSRLTKKYEQQVNEVLSMLK